MTFESVEVCEIEECEVWDVLVLSLEASVTSVSICWL